MRNESKRNNLIWFYDDWIGQIWKNNVHDERKILNSLSLSSPQNNLLTFYLVFGRLEIFLKFKNAMKLRPNISKFFANLFERTPFILDPEKILITLIKDIKP